ncbi:MAG: SCO family protein [Leptospiraceae bacterium]|nr:SCO family protein [Leptospiraceae bacterium]
MNSSFTLKNILLSFALPIFLVAVALSGIFFQVELTYLFQRGNYYGMVVDKKAYDFELLNHKGQAIQLSSFKNNYVFLYFGYLQCYSICTKSFFILYKIAKQLNRNDIKFVIVSIDPERDTFDDMQKFMKEYGENFYVLKPDRKSMNKIAKQYGVVVQYISNPDKYELDHTNYIFLIDKKGYIRFVYLNKRDDYKQIVHDLNSLRDF